MWLIFHNQEARRKWGSRRGSRLRFFSWCFHWSGNAILFFLSKERKTNELWDVILKLGKSFLFFLKKFVKDRKIFRRRLAGRAESEYIHCEIRFLFGLVFSRIGFDSGDSSRDRQGLFFSYPMLSRWPLKIKGKTRKVGLVSVFQLFASLVCSY